MKQPTELDLLAQAWREAKINEAEWNKERLRLESELLAKFCQDGQLPDEGSHNVCTDFFKINFTNRLNRSINIEEIQDNISLIPEDIFSSVIRFEPVLNLREYRKVSQEYPEIYNIISKGVIAKPAKTAINVELINND